jgi:hypothetical protein
MSRRTRDLGGGLAAVEDRDVVTGAHQLVHEREPVELRAAHDQDLHVHCSFIG